MDKKVFYCHGVEAALLKATTPVDRSIRVKSTLRRLFLKYMPGFYLSFKPKINKLYKKFKAIKGK